MYHVKMFKCYLCMSVRYATAIEICLYVKNTVRPLSVVVLMSILSVYI